MTCARPPAGAPGTRHELILGGARSGKSRTAEARAAAWLQGGDAREAVLVATALAADDEMAARIARHRADRAERVPQLATHEEAVDLAGALARLDSPQRLLVVDCLTLWLCQALLPPPGGAAVDAAAAQAALLQALQRARSPVVLVSNEIGLGVLPMSREARACVDALGRLHQQVAAACARVTLMVAGIELCVKDER
jgi:adenosylcobinamide kinase / adenosylcobinamide-phosphate guanylyltransferase